MKRRTLSCAIRVWIALALLVMAFPVVGVEAARNLSDPQDFYGIVGLDPWYEYNTDPENHPNDVNRTFLENKTALMAEMGVRWVRFEFHAEYDQAVGPGWIDYSKSDWFIKELAPKYNIKVLAVLGSGVLADLDKTYEFSTINNTPDDDGRNHYSRAFVDRTREIADHYGDSIAAYEILNEPNANALLDAESKGRVKEVNPEIYGRIVVDTWNDVKAAHPDVQFVMGSLLHDAPNGGPIEHLDWLERVYESKAISGYVRQTGRHAFDGVSIHPYYLGSDELVEHMNELRDIQRSYGDDSGIWITEIGLPAEPPSWSSYGIMDPTASESQQATYLHEVFTTLRDRTPFIERVFWFKFEDFGGAGVYANWGVIRIRDANFRYGPDATPWPRKEAFRVYQSLARPEAAPTAKVEAPDDLGPRVLYFPETGHTLRDPFLRYWESRGGLAMFGYPRTEVFYVGGRAVQYFERARFEYWPEHQGTQWEVQFGLLGQYVARNRTFTPHSPPSESNPDRVYFPQTRQYLAFGFKDYWEQNGGLSMFGYPISAEFDEVNPEDGQTYTVQYFERARFEWHPEHRGTPYEVQLGLLGNQVLVSPGWYR